MRKWYDDGDGTSKWMARDRVISLFVCLLLSFVYVVTMVT